MFVYLLFNFSVSIFKYKSLLEFNIDVYKSLSFKKHFFSYLLFSQIDKFFVSKLILKLYEGIILFIDLSLFSFI